MALQPRPVHVSQGFIGPSVGHHEHFVRKYIDASVGSLSRHVLPLSFAENLGMKHLDRLCWGRRGAGSSLLGPGRVPSPCAGSGPRRDSRPPPGA